MLVKKVGSCLKTLIPKTQNTVSEPLSSDLKFANQLEKDTVQFSKRVNPLPVQSRMSICESSVKSGGMAVAGHYPKEYVTKNSGMYELKPRYHIDKIWSSKKGDGASSLQSIVMKSLQSSQTCGRVTLEACCIDWRTAPGGFYYKMGFRFVNPETNKACEQWIKSGGKYEDAPFAIGQMFLPKENIEHCLKYDLNDVVLKYYQKYIDEFKRLGLL